LAMIHELEQGTRQLDLQNYDDLESVSAE